MAKNCDRINQASLREGDHEVVEGVARRRDYRFLTSKDSFIALTPSVSLRSTAPSRREPMSKYEQSISPYFAIGV